MEIDVFLNESKMYHCYNLYCMNDPFITFKTFDIIHFLMFKFPTKPTTHVMLFLVLSDMVVDITINHSLNVKCTTIL